MRRDIATLPARSTLLPREGAGRVQEVAGALRRQLVAWGVRDATGGATGPLSVVCAAHRHAGAQTSRLLRDSPARSTLLPREGAGRA